MTKERSETPSRHSDFVIPSGVVIRHSSLSSGLIATSAQLTELLEKIEPVDRVAIDTEADSLHCYREKLCLLQAARLLGIREFSLAALVERFFGVKLAKGSQKANWARRPLPERMVEYAMNDTHYLLPLADRLESQLREQDRLDWLGQSCERAIEQAAAERVRDVDEAWCIRGSGALRGRAAAVLRALWQWREKEAEAVDRPAFHILQNDELLRAAESFASGSVPDYRYFLPRRRRAFRDAAQSALQLPEDEWPVSRRRFGTRPSAEVVRRSEELRHRRDRAARELELEPTFVAPRATLEAIAADQTRASALLVPWQQQLLGTPRE